MLLSCVVALSSNLMSDEGSKILLSSYSDRLIVQAKLTDKKAQEEYEQQVKEKIEATRQWIQGKCFWLTICGALLLCASGVASLVFTARANKIERNLEDNTRVLQEDLNTLRREKGDLQRSIETMKNNHDADIYAIVQSYLVTLGAIKLRFTDKGTAHDRISLYCFDEGDRSIFIRLGRFSYTRDYMLSGRKQYPATQGCIAVAWRDGVSFHVLPGPAKKTEFVRAHQAMNLTKDEIGHLSMPSQLYFGYRVMDQSSTARAVIVVESTSPERFARQELERIFSEEQQFLSFLVQRLGSLMPRPSEAARLGF